jgi:lipopolysaccharide/colanic/teichoic acid biosynthesis glycosyltransferase
VVSLSLLLLLSVPLLVVALLIVTTSKGGVLFAHERIGKRGRPFKMLKFRSMVADADAQLAALATGAGEWRPATVQGHRRPSDHPGRGLSASLLDR